jgi:general stress protein 26
MTPEQKEKLAALLRSQHVATLITQGGQWPTGTMQAFAETESLELIFIVGDHSEKYQDMIRNPKVTALVDNRDTGSVATFEINRASFQGIAKEVIRDSAEWNSLKEIFLDKNSFEAPFFASPGLKMVRVAPARIAYSGGLKDNFKLAF